jgi:tetraacyldisaccharide 4'-kinase
VYDGITALRNTLYDRSYKPSTRFALPVISVGNLAVGGTGKTPMVEYLIRLLAPEFQLATLSRGYGRKTKGFRIAGAADTAATLGDEPYQLYKKFSPQVEVTVGEERAYAIPMILQERETIQAIILDDAFQHRSVTPGFSILLTEYGNPFFNDYVLPVGRLREAKSGADRADMVVVTKCPPHTSEDEMMAFENHIHSLCTFPVSAMANPYHLENPVRFPRR